MTLIAVAYGIGMKYSVLSTNDEGRVQFPRLKANTGGTGDSTYVVKAGNRNSNAALIEFDDNGRISAWWYKFKKTDDGVARGVDPVDTFKYAENGTVEQSHKTQVINK